MMYLILSQPSTAYAEAISEKLYNLSRPVRHSDDVTRFYSGHLVHDDGRVAVVFPDPGELPIHPDASQTDLPDLIQAAITAGEKTKLGQDIGARKGKRSVVVDFLPASILAKLKTREEMEADGWFPE